MKIEEKTKLVTQLSNVLESSKGVWFTDFTNLLVVEMSELRRTLRNNSLSYQVIKKSILLRALNKLNVEIADEWLDGPVGICTGDDIILGSRLLISFQRGRGNFKIKGCWFEGKNFSLDEIKQVATLPGREELIAKLLTTLSSPLYGLVQIFQTLETNLVNALTQIRDNKESK